MTRYKDMFSRLAEKNQGAFVPFTVIGFPGIEESIEIIQALVDGGADALELGIPFSDPVADGPVIQSAGARALETGTTPSKCFEAIAKIREKNPDIPIGLLVYANLAVSNGADNFYAACQTAGADSVLIADLPVYEAGPFVKAAEERNILPVFIAPPNASDERLEKIAALTEGYTYVTARSGVTGADEAVEIENKNIFQKLNGFGAPPSMLGFGISNPDHVRTAILSGADGAISGSAVVSKIAAGASDLEKLCAELRAFVSSMKAAASR